MAVKKPVLAVIFGLPGTGKTTMARILSKALEFKHLNTDKVRAALGMRDRYTEKDKAVVYKRLLKQAEAHLRDGEDLVVDGTFSREVYRDSLRQIALRTGAVLKWIQTMASEEAVRARVGKERPYSQADFEVYRKIRDEFDTLKEAGLEEVCLEVWTDRQSQGKSLDQMRQFLST